MAGGVGGTKRECNVYPDEAKEIWDSLDAPTLESCQLALKQMGKTISMKTLSVWRRNGWTNPSKKTDLQKTMTDLDAASRGLTNGQPLQEYAQLFADRQAFAQKSIEEREEILLTNAQFGENFIWEKIPEIYKKYPDTLPAILKSLSDAATANQGRADKIVSRALRTIESHEVMPSGMRKDHPLAADIENLGRVNP